MWTPEPYSCLAYKETNTSTPRSLVQVLDLGPGNVAWQCASSDLPSVTYYRCSPDVSALNHTQKWSQDLLVAEAGFVVSFL